MDYFTGKALEYEIDEDEDFDDDDDDDDDGESLESGSVQDSESDGFVPARATRGLPKKRPAGAAGGNSNPEECKHQ